MEGDARRHSSAKPVVLCERVGYGGLEEVMWSFCAAGKLCGREGWAAGRVALGDGERKRRRG